MALTTRTLPALMNGISRQPAILRSSDQTEDELNTWGDIARGVSRRPPTRTLQQLSGLTLGSAMVHHINRDVTERYTVIIDQGSIKVFDETTGAAKTVNAPLGWGYLDATGPNYRAVTIADYTFIVNTAKIVAMKAAGADETAQDTNLRFAGGSSPTHVNADLAASTFYVGKAYQYVANPSSAGGLTGTVADETKLPTPPAGIYKVAGSSTSDFTSYYVRADADGVSWDETVKPGLINALDEATMPHVLIREADGTFTFAPFSWQPRRVGDATTNPAPPFVNRTIRDVFFYQNRLAFLSDESVIFSAAGDYGQFWRRTVLDYVDSDALAASATTTDVAILEYAIPFSDGVMLFSKQRQLSLTNGDTGLNAHSLAIQPVTSYLMSPEVKPTPMGSQVHFVSSSSGQTAVQEYTRLAGASPTEAADITAHVPGLLPEGASQLIPAHDLSALFVIANNATDRTKMYAYQFFWDGDKKLQSAWRVWDFGDGKPVSGAYESGALHLLVERPDGYFLEQIDLTPQAVSDNQNHTIFLDRQVSVTGTYDSVSNTTTFTAPFTVDSTKVRLVRSKLATAPESVISPADYTVSGTTVKVPGDESAHPVTLGHLYTTRMTISQQFPMDWQGRALTTGRMVMHTFTVNLSESAYTRAEVYPYGDGVAGSSLKSTEEWTGRSVGTAIIGQQAYASAAWTFSVAGDSKLVRIDLINDTAFGSTWTSGEWEALFFSRAL